MGKTVITITEQQLCRLVEQSLEKLSGNEKIKIGNGIAFHIDKTKVKSGNETTAKDYSILKIYKGDTLVSSITHNKGKGLNPINSTKLIKGLSQLSNIKANELDALLAKAEIKGISSNAILGALN